MQLRNKIPRQTQVRNKIANLDELNGFVDRDCPNSTYAHLIQNYIFNQLNDKIIFLDFFFFNFLRFLIPDLGFPGFLGKVNSIDSDYHWNSRAYTIKENPGKAQTN